MYLYNQFKSARYCTQPDNEQGYGKCCWLQHMFDYMLLSNNKSRSLDFN